MERGRVKFKILSGFIVVSVGSDTFREKKNCRFLYTVKIYIFKSYIYIFLNIHEG